MGPEMQLGLDRSRRTETWGEQFAGGWEACSWSTSTAFSLWKRPFLVLPLGTCGCSTAIYHLRRNFYFHPASLLFVHKSTIIHWVSTWHYYSFSSLCLTVMNAVYGKDCASFSALISDLEKATSLLQTKVLFRLNCLSGMHGFCFGSCG